MSSLLLAAWALVPLFAYGPRVLDDSRLDGGLMALVAAATVAAVWPDRGRLRAPRGSLLLLAGLGLGLLPLIGTPWAQVVGGLADRAPWLAAGAVLVVATHRKVDLERAWTAVLLGGALASAVALLQLIGLDLFGLKSLPESPPTGFWSNRPQAVEWMTLLVLVGAARLPLPRGAGPGPRPALRWLLLLGPAALLCGYLDVTAARLALPAGLAWLAWRARERLAPALALLLLFAGGELVRVAAPPPFATRDVGEAGVGPWASTEGRAWMYGAGIAKAAHTPLGIGLGRFERDYPEWRPAEERRMSASDYENVATRRPKTPHSEPLLLLLELGWLGALLVAAGLLRLLRDPARARWTNPALLALGVFALVRAPLSDGGPALALAVLLLAARRRDAIAEAMAETRPGGSRLPALAWPSCAALAVLAVLPAPAQLVGEWTVARRIPLDEEKPPALLETAVAWRPWDSRAWNLLAVDRSRQPDAEPEAIVAALEQSLRHDPTDLYALTARFKVEMERGRETEALALLGRAEQIAPQHPAVRGNRTAYMRVLADAHRLRGLELLEQQNAAARPHMERAQLWRAMAAIRDGDTRTAAKALRAAAVYAASQQGLIERVANDPELDEARVRALLLERVPEQAAALGPAAD